MKDFLKNLLEYSHHSNLELIKVFLDIQNDKLPSEKARSYMSHILNASSVWNSRILGIPNRVGIWEMCAVEKMTNFENANFEETLQILKNFDIQQQISYTNSKGVPFTKLVGDIIFHLVNHATYHRGQIAVEFRNSGIEPIATDYIFYKKH